MNSDSLKLLIQAGNPIIAMETPDEPRAVGLVARSGPRTWDCPLREWSVTEGLQSAPPSGRRRWSSRARWPRRCGTSRKLADPTLYLFKDLGPHCKDPQIVACPPRPVFFPRLAALDADPGGRRAAAARSPPPDRPLRRRLAGRRGA